MAKNSLTKIFFKDEKILIWEFTEKSDFKDRGGGGELHNIGG